MPTVAVALFVAVGHAQNAGVGPRLSGSPEGVTAFVNVNVVPMDTERVLPKQTVLVEGGRITALGPSTKLKVPSGAVRIDGRGKYLIPGLGDMHVHLYMGAGADPERHLFLYVANGVTTVRNMDYRSPALGPQALRLKARAAAGELWSPRIYTAGVYSPHAYVREYDAETQRRWGVTEDGTTPGDLAAHLAAYKAAGYDFIKLYDEPDSTLDSVVVIARRLGIPFSGHRRRSVEWALTVGYASLEHQPYFADTLLFRKPAAGDKSMYWNYRQLHQAMRAQTLSATDSAILRRQRQLIDTTRIPGLAAAIRRAGVWTCPTFAMSEVISVESQFRWPPAWPEVRYVDPETRGSWTSGGMPGPDYRLQSEITGVLGAQRQLIKALQDSGAGLLLGTDSPFMNHMAPGFAVHRELEALVRAGLTPYQALATGTRNVAVFWQTLDEAGTVAVGKRADLVLLSGNPLTAIRHTARPAGVMVGGRWLPREELDRRLAGIELSVWLSDASLASNLDTAQRAVLASHRTQFKALADSLALAPASARTPTAHERAERQRALQRFGTQLKAIRVLLTPEQQVGFDALVRGWMREHAKE